MEVSLKSMPGMKNLYLRIVDSLQDKDKQLHSLKRAYIGAFSIIGILSLLGHFVTAHLTSNEKENAEVTFTITNMRSLVDTIVSQATIFKNSGDSFDDNLITTSIDSLKEGRAKVEAYGDEATNAILNDSQFLLNKRISDFIKISDDFLKYKRTNQHTEMSVAYTALTGESSKVLEINLDLALEQYRSDILQEINRAYQLQLGFVGIIIVVLFLEALFIFNPLVKHLEEYHKYLIKLALTDMLTGLNNRRAFMQLANAGIDHFKRHKKPFVLVLMDLDHFKNVNDTYGHKVGDLVLQHYSSLMQKTLRAHDTLGRIGGEEFAIFLPQITAEEALPLIERCRKRVAETPCSYTDGSGEIKSLSYSSSFGAVAVSEGGWTLDELFIRADEQLYKAKEKGRNCVVIHPLGGTKPA
jgi:diguanylate cyclase (GGDEF)-like protein